MKSFFACLTLGWLSTAQVHAHEPPDVRIENGVLSAEISPAGAQLMSLMAKDSGREFLWHGDRQFWSNRAPLMFPVNVRFKGDRYTYRDNSYVIPKMGLAIYRPFKVLLSGKTNEARFELTANKDTLRQYPFDFRLQVTYRLRENSLINEFVVENQGAEVMPFALGGHPGFTFPVGDEDQREDFEYWFSQKLTTDRNEISGSLIQPKMVPFLKGESTLSFGDQRIPNGGLLIRDARARVIGLAKHGHEPFVTVDLGDFGNVNLWSPPGFPFACIEPMVGHHDLQDGSEAIEEKDYLVRLGPGESNTYRFTITVHPDR